MVGQQLARSTAKSKPISLNWMLRDDDLELLDGETGLVVPMNSRDTARCNVKVLSMFCMRCVVHVNYSSVDKKCVHAELLQICQTYIE